MPKGPTIEVTWYGHASWMVTTAQHKILIDPFLDDSPTSPVKAADVSPDFILVSHGHSDHVADVEKIARASGAMVIAMFEIAEWYGRKGIENRLGMNVGGTTNQPFGTLKMTPALHSSSLPDGTYAGSPAGLLLTIDEKRIYFACDTGLFTDMTLIGSGGLDLAVLPIGDLYTMGPEDSIEAIKLLHPRTVLPAHYNTWPPIEQDGDAWASEVKAKTGATPVVLNPGESHLVD